MTIHYRTQGFFIKKNDRGEADQLFTIYTKNYGKLEILGKAIRKIKSKLRGGAELFYLSEIEFIQGKTYKTLTDAVLINNFQNIRNDFEKLKIAYKISEDLNSLIKGQEPDQEIWSLLIQTFQELNTRYKIPARNASLRLHSDAGGPARNATPACIATRSVADKQSVASGQDTEYKIYYYFFWNFVSILGYQPELKRFSIFYKDKKEKINVDVFKILRIIFKKDIKTLLRLRLKPFHQKSLKNISQRYFDCMCER